MTPLEAVTSAAAAWGGLAQEPRLIAQRENAVFEAHLLDGRRSAIRLHRAGYQSRSAIEAELTWTAALTERGFPCPAPLSADVVETPAGFVTAIKWIDARPIGAKGVPFSGTLTEQVPLYERVGTLLADLHQKTAELNLSALDRPYWDIPGLVGDDPHWGRFWLNPALTPAERDRMLRLRDHARAWLEETQPPLQLIHADALQENILDDGSQLWLIDFDDSGWGFAGYELGAAISQHLREPDEAPLRDALYRGYGLPTTDAALWEVLRACASMGWIADRADPDDPKLRYYAQRALDLTDRVLGA